jgi:hypothetical protein
MQHSCSTQQMSLQLAVLLVQEAAAAGIDLYGSNQGVLSVGEDGGWDDDDDADFDSDDDMPGPSRHEQASNERLAALERWVRGNLCFQVAQGGW